VRGAVAEAESLLAEKRAELRKHRDTEIMIMEFVAGS
jgi:hypothetical protein